MSDKTYSGVRPMAVNSEGISFVKNIMAPTRDGTKLAMDIHVPAGEGPWPVILTYIPYRKDDQEPLTGMQHHWAQHGYVGARVDCRGTGSSEGSNDDEYRPVEQRDGYDVIEWIAGQDWCDGKVAMTGGSYGGFSSVQVAALAPPHLETIIPWNYTDDRYTDDCHYRGGALRCYYDIGSYGCSMVGMNSMPPILNTAATAGPSSGRSAWSRTPLICSRGWPTRRTEGTGAPAAFGAATMRSRPRRCSSEDGATATATRRSGPHST